MLDEGCLCLMKVALFDEGCLCLRSCLCLMRVVCV